MDKAKMIRQQGAALLVFAFVLLLGITWLIFALSKSGQLAQKVSANEYRSEQAFEAAEAGLNFGVVYLKNNRSTIVADADANGYIDNYSNSSTSNVTLANGSKYSITYSNPTANDFSVITITATGTSADNSATREVRQQIKYTPTLQHYSNYPMVVKGNISLAGSSMVQNTETVSNIQAGGTITISGGAETVTSGGTSSTSSSLQSDVSQNTASLQALSANSFFAEFFGTTPDAVKSTANYSYQNSSNTNYSSTLNGKQGALIWIEQTGGTTATIDGNSTVIGTAANPVVLIVNGNLRLQGSAVINGYVFVTGSLQTAGSADVNGGIAVGGNVTDSGNYTLTFSSSILTKAQQVAGSYAKIPGSWNDLKQ